MPHMIHLMSPNKNLVNFPLRYFTSFLSRRITRFWIGDENIPLLSFLKKRVSRNGFHKGSFLHWNIQDEALKVTTQLFLGGTLLKNVDIVGCCFFSAMITYGNFLINYNKITKVIIVKILFKEMNVLINCKTNINK